MPFTMPSRKEFSQEQLQVLSQFDHESRSKIAVVGGPGTGKTVLAIQIINDVLTRKNLRSCFIVFNKPLSRFIDANLRINNGGKTISANAQTWNQWLYWLLINKCNYTPEEIFNDIQHGHKYEYDFDAVSRVTNQNIDGFLYDVFFIDEAQDIPNGLMQIIKQLSKNVYVFLDLNQRVGNDKDYYNQDECQILSILDCEEDYYDLTTNFRNTRQIEMCAKMFGHNYAPNDFSLNEGTAKRTGNKAIKLLTKSMQATVSFIINKASMNPTREIGVFLPKFDGSKDVFNSYQEEFNLQLGHMNGRKPNFQAYFGGEDKDHPFSLSSGISLMTFRNSKGLEFDSVYLLETNNPNYMIEDRLEANQLYVAITRARDYLYFVMNDWEPGNKVSRLIDDNPQLFDEETAQNVNHGSGLNW